TLFFFILTCNWLEAIPFNQLYDLIIKPIIGRPAHMELAAPTSDLNTTVALALMVFTFSIYAGIRERGWGYFKHFFEPMFLFLPINIMEEISKPFSLSIRLFANIFAKVIILLILIKLLAFPFAYPIPLIMLSIFIGFIQAFIFALLTTVYLSLATSAEH
ncbi:MAG: F0F1 ATP synthase subunit A, partial [bacterium]